MLEVLVLITICSLICSLLLWRLLTAQNNKAQAAYATHRKDHKEVLTKTKSERRELRLLLNAFDDALIITNSDGVNDGGALINDLGEILWQISFIMDADIYLIKRI